MSNYQDLNQYQEGFREGVQSERARILAELQSLADTFVNDLHSEIDARFDIEQLIQRLKQENP